MKYLKIYFLVFQFLFMIISVAQNKGTTSMQWKKVNDIPGLNMQQKALGIAGAVIGVHHGFLMIAGGCNFPNGMPWEGGAKKYYADGVVLKRTDKGSFDVQQCFRLPKAVAYAAACSTPLGIVAVGGENQFGLQASVFLAKWNTKTMRVQVDPLPDLPLAVSNAAIACIGEKIFVAGGEVNDSVSSALFAMDLVKRQEGWKRMSSLPMAVSHAVMVVRTNSQHKSLAIIGGRRKNPGDTSTIYSSMFEFNLVTNQWVKRAALPYALAAGTGISRNNSIVLFGGDRGETFHRTETLIAAINAETDSLKKGDLVKQKIALQSAHPGFCKDVLLYDTNTNSWKKIGSIPFDVPATTTAVWNNGEIFIPGGEIRAGVRTPGMLIGKIHLKEFQ